MCVLKLITAWKDEKDRPTRLYVDHGPKGVAATVAQGYKVEGQRQLQWRAVHHSSRALTKAELNYQKIEGESLAVYSGIKSNQRYLLGTEFEAITILPDQHPPG